MSMNWSDPTLLRYRLVESLYRCDVERGMSHPAEEILAEYDPDIIIEAWCDMAMYGAETQRDVLYALSHIKKEELRVAQEYVIRDLLARNTLDRAEAVRAIENTGMFHLLPEKDEDLRLHDYINRVRNGHEQRG